jgi:hypothetical protein
MDKQIFVDRILETENLTDELEDDDANWLIDWGIGQLDGILDGLEDEEAAGERVTDLMAVMRKINRISGAYASKSQETLVEALAELKEVYNQVFHPGGETSFAPQADDLQSAASHLTDLEPGEVVRYLAGGDFQATHDSANPVA